MSAVYIMPVPTSGCGRCRSLSGFTLIELIISIGIFALVSAISYSGIASVLTSYRITEAHADQFADLQMALLVIERDFAHMIARPIRGGYGEKVHALQAGRAFRYMIEFSKAGRSNPLQKNRSQLQRIAYDLQSEQLIRYSWTVLDRLPNSQQQSQLLLENILSFEIRYLNKSRQWQDVWPSTKQGLSKDIPIALEFVIETEQLGKIRRVIPIQV